MREVKLGPSVTSPPIFTTEWNRYCWHWSVFVVVFLRPGRNLFHWKSSVSWSSVQRRSWHTEDIQVDSEAAQHIVVWKTLGPQPAGSLLQLQGLFYIVHSSSDCCDLMKLTRIFFLFVSPRSIQMDRFIRSGMMIHRVFVLRLSMWKQQDWGVLACGMATV